MVSDWQSCFKKFLVPNPLCTRPSTFFQPKHQCLCYFIHKGSTYHFIWKQTPGWKKNFFFENHRLVVWNSGDNRLFVQSWNKFRLFPKGTAGWACRNPWDPFPYRFVVYNLPCFLRLPNWALPTISVLSVAKVRRSAFIQQCILNLHQRVQSFLQHLPKVDWDQWYLEKTV